MFLLVLCGICKVLEPIDMDSIRKSIEENDKKGNEKNKANVDGISNPATDKGTKGFVSVAKDDFDEEKEKSFALNVSKIINSVNEEEKSVSKNPDEKAPSSSDTSNISFDSQSTKSTPKVIIKAATANATEVKEQIKKILNAIIEEDLKKTGADKKPIVEVIIKNYNDDKNVVKKTVRNESDEKELVNEIMKKVERSKEVKGEEAPSSAAEKEQKKSNLFGWFENAENGKELNSKKSDEYEYAYLEGPNGEIQKIRLRIKKITYLDSIVEKNTKFPEPPTKESQSKASISSITSIKDGLLSKNATNPQVPIVSITKDEKNKASKKDQEDLSKAKDSVLKVPKVAPPIVKKTKLQTITETITEPTIIVLSDTPKNSIVSVDIKEKPKGIFNMFKKDGSDTSESILSITITVNRDMVNEVQKLENGGKKQVLSGFGKEDNKSEDKTPTRVEPIVRTLKYEESNIPTPLEFKNRIDKSIKVASESIANSFSKNEDSKIVDNYSMSISLVNVQKSISLDLENIVKSISKENLAYSKSINKIEDLHSKSAAVEVKSVSKNLAQQAQSVSKELVINLQSISKDRDISVQSISKDLFQKVNILSRDLKEAVKSVSINEKNQSKSIAKAVVSISKEAKDEFVSVSKSMVNDKISVSKNLVDTFKTVSIDFNNTMTKLNKDKKDIEKSFEKIKASVSKDDIEKIKSVTKQEKKENEKNNSNGGSNDGKVNKIVKKIKETFSSNSNKIKKLEPEKISAETLDKGLVNVFKMLKKDGEESTEQVIFKPSKEIPSDIKNPIEVRGRFNSISNEKNGKEIKFWGYVESFLNSQV